MKNTILKDTTEATTKAVTAPEVTAPAVPAAGPDDAAPADGPDDAASKAKTSNKKIILLVLAIGFSIGSIAISVLMLTNVINAPLLASITMLALGLLAMTASLIKFFSKDDTTPAAAAAAENENNDVEGNQQQTQKKPEADESLTAPMALTLKKEEAKGEKGADKPATAKEIAAKPATAKKIETSGRIKEQIKALEANLHLSPR